MVETKTKARRELLLNLNATLEKMAALLNDPKNPPADLIRAEMLKALQGVQAAMERLQNVKTE